MKYFKSPYKDPEHRDPFGKNEGPLWQAISKLFNQGKPIRQHFSIGFSSIINTARQQHLIDESKAYEQEYIHQNPTLEDNSNDTNY